tara:strand:- start:11798 stop:12514 length:717 start_codon:yes stop_codon:yes gene_type:complete
MEQNKIRSYSFYALGEILLVVIGILIALQVNTWNQHSNDRAGEHLYLTQLISELNEDKFTLETEYQKLQDQIPVMKDVLTILNDKPVDIIKFEEKLREYYLLVLYPYYFSSNMATFEEMKSSGNLGLIQDQTIRNEIIQLYNKIEELEKWFSFNQEFVTPSVIQLSYEFGLSRFIPQTDSIFSNFSNIQNEVDILAHRDALINNLAIQYWSVYDIETTLSDQIALIDSMVFKIENYLN